MNEVPEILVGNWTYRSFFSDPDLNKPVNELLFGFATLSIHSGPMEKLIGRLITDRWELDLNGSISYGNPFCLRYQAKGFIDGEERAYDYVGYLVPNWSNGVDQHAAIVGSVVCTVPSSFGNESSAGLVAQWIAVKQ